MLLSRLCRAPLRNSAPLCAAAGVARWCSQAGGSVGGGASGGTSKEEEELLVSSQRTATTAALWKSRGQKRHRPTEYNTNPKTPSDSTYVVDVNFKADKKLRSQYENFRGGVRLGKFLEDLDALAAHVAHLHAEGYLSPKDPPLATIVTAAVDHIKVWEGFRLDQHLQIEGRMTWVGRSSMEVSTTITDKDRPGSKLLEALFLMVAIGTHGKGTSVPALIPQTEEEKKRFAEGEENKAFRIEDAKTSLSVAPPKAEEVALLHKLFQAEPQPPVIATKKTHRQSLVLCEPQEKNVANKIFGGFLMQKAYEIAFATIIQVTGCTAPVFLGVDDISFLHPVEIASIITFNCHVTHTNTRTSPGPRAYHVRVTTDVDDLKTGQKNRCNILHFAFGCTPTEGQVLPAIQPHTYREGVLYLEGRRRLLRTRDEARLGGSSLCDPFFDP